MHPSIGACNEKEQTMGILDRFADIIKANINDLLDKAEDPAKIIDQYMRELTDIETLNARRETIKAKAAVAKTQAKVNQFTSGAGAAFAPRAASAGEAKAADKPAEGHAGVACVGGEKHRRIPPLKKIDSTSL